MFLTEILFKTLRQSEPDESLFLFVENSILQFDCCQTGIQNFHLIFLLKLTRYLGFEPNVEEFGEYFDLLNGVFQDFKPAHVHFLMPEVTLNFKKLLEIDYSSLDKLILSRENRMVLLLSIIEYYRLHIPEFQQLQSLSVLQGLFD